MARRIKDVPDDAEWPELEEEFIPEEDPLPDAGGPFTKAYAYLHGARSTLDSNLVAPTRLLAATAARYILLVADETDTQIDPSEREAFERFAEGKMPHDTHGLVDTLTRLSAFVETQVQAAREREDA